MRTLSLILLLFITGVNHCIAQDSEEHESPLSCGGVERWSVKVLTDNEAVNVNFTPVPTTISALVSLVTPAPSSTMVRYAGVEDKTWTATCRITIKKYEADNDYHLVLSDGTNTLIGEVPDPACSAASASAHQAEYLQAWQFVEANIPYGNYGNVYDVNIPPVIVTGVAFIDPPHGQTGKAPNNLEIHPILNIHFAPLGVNLPASERAVSIYPNPFKDRLTITTGSSAKSADFILYDYLSREVFRRTLSITTENIFIPSLADGLYFYRVLSDGNIVGRGQLLKED